MKRNAASAHGTETPIPTRAVFPGGGDVSLTGQTRQLVLASFIGRGRRRPSAARYRTGGAGDAMKVIDRARPANCAGARDGIQGQAFSGSAYLRLLTWAFTLFNSVRVLAYLPTLWAIQASADASQHSLWTWLIWVGANATMAAWLYENNGRRMNRAIAVSIGNTGMCMAAVLLIATYRW